MTNSISMKNKFQLKDIIFFCSTAILLVDQIALSAAVGPYAVFWWLVTLVLFMLPNNLVTAEMGSGYPEQGGIYTWVRDAFGTRWAARITWAYWVNIALWVPSVFIMFAGLLSAMFFPELTLWHQIGIGLFFIAVTCLVNCSPIYFTKIITNTATPLKIIIIVIVGSAGINYGMTNGFATDVSFGAALSNLDAGLAYIPVLVYGCLGLELIMSESNKIVNPQRNIPRAIFATGLLASAFYIFGTLGILAAVPAEKVDIISIFSVTLNELFGDVPMGSTIVTVLGISTLFTFFGTMVAWTSGGNAAMAEAGQEQEMPAVFGKMREKSNAPAGSAILLSCLSGFILVVYGLMAENAEELFWTLFSFSGIIFLLPYIAMHCSFLKFRATKTTPEGAFRIPGGQFVAKLIAFTCIFILCLSILLFFWIPGEPVDYTYVMQIGVGLILTLGYGEILVRVCEKKRNNSPNGETQKA